MRVVRNDIRDGTLLIMQQQQQHANPDFVSLHALFHTISVLGVESSHL